MKMNRLVGAICGLTILGLAISVRATSYNAAADFSIASNTASDVWNYGRYDGLNSPTFTLFTDNTLQSILSGDPAPGAHNLQEWSAGSGIYDPNVTYNPGDTFTTPDLSQIEFDKKTLTVGPYLGPTVIRFNNFIQGYYNISAAFKTVQQGNSVPYGYVYINGAVDKQMDLGSPWAYQNANVFLAKNDTVDFVVYSGTKSTQVNATVAAVPLPTSAGVGFSMLAGAGLLAFYRKRLRRTSQIAV